MPAPHFQAVYSIPVTFYIVHLSAPERKTDHMSDFISRTFKAFLMWRDLQMVSSFTAFSFARQMRLLISVVQSPLAVFIEQFELLYLLYLLPIYLQVYSCVLSSSDHDLCLLRIKQHVGCLAFID